MALEQNGNLIFGIDNRIDDSGTVLMAYSEDTSLPATNLKDETIANPFRTASADNNNINLTMLDVYYSTEYETSLLGIINHKLHRLATYKLWAASRAAWTNLESNGGASVAASSAAVQLIANTQNVYVKSGNRFRFTGDTQVYKATADLLLGINRLTYSEDFSHANWSKTNMTVSADSTTSPDETTSADTLVDNTTNGQHYCEQTVSQAANASQVFQVCVKKNTLSKLTLTLFESSATANFVKATVDLVAKTITTSVGGTGTVSLLSKLTELKNGWFKIILIGQPTTNATTGILARINLLNSAGSNSYAGTGQSLYGWGALMRAGSAEMDYVKTTGSALNTSSGTLSLSPNIVTAVTTGTDLECLTGDYIYSRTYDSDDLYPTGISAWQSIADSLSLSWEYPEWWFAQMTDQQAQLFYMNSFFLLPSIVFAKFFRIKFNNTLDTKSYFDIGRLYLGTRQQIPYNFEYGAPEGVNDLSPRKTTLGGVIVKDPRPRQRKASYKISEVPETPITYRPFFKDLQNRIAMVKQFVIIPKPSDIIESHYNAFMCSQSQVNDIAYVFPTVSGTQIDVVEEK